MSLDVGWQIPEGRSDTPVCLVVRPQTCSHTHHSWEYWRPLLYILTLAAGSTVDQPQRDYQCAYTWQIMSRATVLRLASLDLDLVPSLQAIKN